LRAGGNAVGPSGPDTRFAVRSSLVAKPTRTWQQWNLAAVGHRGARSARRLLHPDGVLLGRWLDA
jgi:hypothetical protein